MTQTAAVRSSKRSARFVPARAAATSARGAVPAPPDVFGAYTALGDTGPLTSRELARALRIDEGYARTWLTWQAQLGYVHRDEFGRYATFCAIPRTLY